MESIADYFALGLESTADFLILGSAIFFIVGIVAFRFEELRINKKSRYYFILALILFVLAIYYGWNDYDVIVKRFWESL